VARDSTDPAAPTTVLAVFAHPDDESLMCGGTLARLADAGVRTVLICGSHGERGSVSDPALVADSDLGSVRLAELRAAADVLGIRDVIALDHKDGDLRWRDVPEFHADIVGAIEAYRPNAVITFAENGLYWHLDHIGVHERTFTAVKSFGAAAPPLYYVTMPKGIIQHVVDTARAKGSTSNESSVWGLEPDAFGESEMAESFSIDIRRWIPRKMAALRCHRTQMGVGNSIAWIDDDDARQWLGLEYFRRSPLECSRTDSVLEDLTEPVASS
jgi:N-acetyl-1-D-myo-inositol-2-amino-2-deoxy-alpha-D-glucopyranoside deacetylase